MKLGDKVRITKRLVRHYVPGDYYPTLKGKLPRKEWKEEPISPPREGIYIGWRTLADGDFHHGSYDEQSYLKRDKYIKAALVVVHERQNAEIVPFSEIDANATSE